MFDRSRIIEGGFYGKEAIVYRFERYFELCNERFLAYGGAFHQGRVSRGTVVYRIERIRIESADR